MLAQFSLSSLFMPGMVLLIVLGLMAVLKFGASRWKKIPPNKVGIFYGRKSGKDGAGFRVVSGGGSLQMPIVESYMEMSTAVFQTEIDENNIPNVDNVRVNVNGIATCKISTKHEDLMNAAKSFLGKSENEIKDTVQNILKGHLRSIIGKLDIDAILRKRDEFNQQVIKESSIELTSIGVQILTLVIQDVNDGYGYIEALGRKTVAEAIRDADIKVAQAKKESDIQVSTAQKEAAKVKAENEAMIADANKERDVKKAQYTVIVHKENAKADVALAIATAAEQQTLKVAEADRDAAEKTAQVKVQEQEALRKEKELIASVVKPAEAAKQKTVIEAEATKQQQILEAEAAKEVQIKKAEADQQAKTLEGEGEASKAKAIGEGQAAATKATLTAAAEGAAAQKGLVLEAEAKGTEKLAEALRKLDSSGKLILVLDRMPNLIDKSGDAGAKIAKEIFGAVGTAVGSIDEIRIVDFGGGSGDNIGKVTNMVPQVIAGTLAKLQTMGVNFGEILEKCGIKTDQLTQLIGEVTKATTAPTAKTEE